MFLLGAAKSGIPPILLVGAIETICSKGSGSYGMRRAGIVCGPGEAPICDGGLRPIQGSVPIR
jgi:hypothetical protein